ncbi:MAG: ribonuclease PH [Planctomycetes bacterium]|nr:ribonuclease PH [Planctomycetota bacterium]
MARKDGRAPNQLREIRFTRDFIGSAAASVLVEWGRTRVIVTASVQDQVPPFLMNTGLGWVTAEYGMLPASTSNRKTRDGRRGPVDGRTIEIQRIIGRALRAIVKQRDLGPRTIWIDCDVIEADAGTRTAAITGAWVVLYDCLEQLRERRIIKKDPLRAGVAAVSVAVVDGKPLLDPDYDEDSRADADLNFVMSHDGGIIEIQGTGEKAPLSRERFDECFALAETGIKSVASLQNRALIRLG